MAARTAGHGAGAARGLWEEDLLAALDGAEQDGPDSEGSTQ